MRLQIGGLSGLAAVAVFAGSAWSRPEPRGAARFDPAGNVVFPADYRHWTYLTSGLGMNYNAAATDEAHPPFDTVFADPTAERAFRATGH